jgi:hypothetical protein
MKSFDANTALLLLCFAAMTLTRDFQSKHVGSLSSGFRRMSAAVSVGKPLCAAKLTICQPDIKHGLCQNTDSVEGIRVGNHANARYHAVGRLETDQAHIRCGQSDGSSSVSANANMSEIPGHSQGTPARTSTSGQLVQFFSLPVGDGTVCRVY